MAVTTKTKKSTETVDVVEKMDNTSPILYSEDGGSEEKEEVMSREEVLEREPDILATLLDLGNAKNDPDELREIVIMRKGVEKLRFRVRPLSDVEHIQCYEAATKYAPSQKGKPRVALKTDNPLLRAKMIYAATVDEDRNRIWNNKEAQRHFNVLRGEELIECVLKAGEKTEILAIIDEISGHCEGAVKLAKNS